MISFYFSLIRICSSKEYKLTDSQVVSFQRTGYDNHPGNEQTPFQVRCDFQKRYRWTKSGGWMKKEEDTNKGRHKPSSSPHRCDMWNVWYGVLLDMRWMRAGDSRDGRENKWKIEKSYCCVTRTEQQSAVAAKQISSRSTPIQGKGHCPANIYIPGGHCAFLS